MSGNFTEDTAAKKLVMLVINNFDRKSKVGLARKLRSALELEDASGIKEKVEEILGRDLNKEEKFKIETIAMLLDPDDMPVGGDEGFDGYDLDECDAPLSS